MNTNHCLRFFHTVRYLKPIQLVGRLWFRLYHPSADLSPAPECRKMGKWNNPVTRQASLISPWRFSFLNNEHRCEFPSDWNNNKQEKLWTYNLHYFDDLQGEDGRARREWHVELIEKWIDDNPPGAGNGWEPYPLSLRIVNWIKWVLSGNQLSNNGIQSLAVQVRYLSKRLEYHLLGNHLFANAKALLFAGLFFEGAEADSWFRKGVDILSRQIPEQILPDGGHFERSPMYHSIILEDLLDCINLMRSCGAEVPPGWQDVLGRMLGWLAGMMHPDGEIVLFNDAAFGIAPGPEELFAYANRLGLGADTVPAGLKHFDTTGYIRVQRGVAVAFLDTAPIGPDYLPGHAHADTLTFELSLFGQRVIVDSGTSCYGVGKERLRQRCTNAHSTVTINGEDSSEVWGGFRVARRAYPGNLKIVEKTVITKIRCSHNGYMRLPGKPIHHREWCFANHSLLVTDRITGPFQEAEARYYFHPAVYVEDVADTAHGVVQVKGKPPVHWKVSGGSCQVVDATWHPEFGLSVASKCLIICFEHSEIEVEFTW